MQSIEEIGNPFNEDYSNLIQLDSSTVMPEEVVNAITSLESIGAKQYKVFWSSVFKIQVKPGLPL